QTWLQTHPGRGISGANQVQKSAYQSVSGRGIPEYAMSKPEGGAEPDRSVATANACLASVAKPTEAPSNWCPRSYPKSAWCMLNSIGRNLFQLEEPPDRPA